MPDTSFDFPKMLCAYDFIGKRAETAFYVPPYQRRFTWGDEDVNRFFESVAAGMKQVVDGGEGVVFIGTVIALESKKPDLFIPSIQDEDIPSAVLHVIDGQQRLTLLIATSVALHNLIRYEEGRASTSHWLTSQCKALQQNLSEMFEMNLSKTVRYPRMIRWGSDSWSEQGLYQSPLSDLCSGYGQFLRNGDNAGGFYCHEFSSVDMDGTDCNAEKTHASFIKANQRIQNIVKKVFEGNREFLDLPDLSELWKNQNILRNLFPPAYANQQMDVDLSNSEHLKVVRVATLAHHILRNVRFVTLATADEEQALEIFQSLNTTGNPLTAIETFKPEVVRVEGWKRYNQQGSSKKHLDRVEKLWGDKDKPEDRKKLTSNLVISFALAESGEKIPADFGKQRKYLRDQYLDLKDVDKRRLFTRHLMHASEVAQLWGDKKQEMPQHGISSEGDVERAWAEACFCLDFLRSANHTIAQALVTRFHESASVAGGNALDLFAIIKATAAFFALWRGCSKIQTAFMIDKRYRDLMKTGVEELNILPFARRFRHGQRDFIGREISAEEVKRAFCHFLRKGESDDRKVRSEAEWVKYTIGVPLYSHTRTVARFLLLIASHDTVPTEMGLLKAGNAGVCPLIDRGEWRKKECKTVEHIVPQSDSTRLGCTKDKLHPLGNLTLLPAKLNGEILGNFEWDKRKYLYRVLAAKTREESEAIITEFCDFLTVSQKRVMHKELRYLPMTAALAQCENFTTEGDIKRRGENLARLAWQRLAVDWLGFEEES